MSQSLAIRLYPEPLRSLAFGSISGTYTGIGSAFANPIRLLILENTTDVTIFFSWDGITDHLALPSGLNIVLDVGSNAVLPTGNLYFAQGQRIYAQGSPTMGDVYLSVFYGVNNLGS